MGYYFIHPPACLSLVALSNNIEFVHIVSN